MAKARRLQLAAWLAAISGTVGSFLFPHRWKVASLFLLIFIYNVELQYNRKFKAQRTKEGETKTRQKKVRGQTGHSFIIAAA